MIKPTVGRVVWYHPGADFDGAMPDEGAPLAALVCAVHSDTLVNLAVFDAQGVNFPAIDVLLLGEGSNPPAGSDWCEWMPYQKGQAAKTEALEAQLKG